MTTEPLHIGVVAIGRNEGPRLANCLRSVRAATTGPTVYVDSGSTDDSVMLARREGVTVVELDRRTPFTAARARNAGFHELMRRDPTLDAVQFIDGDCQLAPGWRDAAIRELASDDTLAVVCGRRRECDRNASIYNRLADMEWNTPVGPAVACGGDALIRTSALRAVNGYDASLICGEEPELCVRLRQAGWTIRRIDRDSTIHDANMTRFEQWWRRSVRCGFAWAQGAAMHGQPPTRHNVRQCRSVWFWALVLPATAIAFAALTGGASLALLAGYPALALKVACHRVRNRRDPWPDALLYGAFCMLGKFAELVGMLRFHAGRLRRQPTTLIEYKPAPPPTAS